MFAVVFEVRPKPERREEYLALARFLKPRLEAVDGFIDNERFASRRRPGLVLSLSTWRDEKALIRWRTQADHHAVQEKGRFEVFEDYRLRVGEVTTDTAPPVGHAVRPTRADETETGEARALSLTEVALAGPPPADADAEAAGLAARLGLDPGRAGLIGHDVFESIYSPGRILLFALWRDTEAAGGWTPAEAADCTPLRHRRVRVIRDYGMMDRREAPQFYPPVNAWPVTPP
jgi:heme-degrading monooxygenase HmoA